MCLKDELETINTLFYNDTSSFQGMESKAKELVFLFKTKSLKRFKQKDIECYFRYLIRQGNENSTINSKLAYLSKALEYHNNKLKMPYQKVYKKHQTIITFTRLKDLLQKIKYDIVAVTHKDELKQFIIIAYYTGLRANEILGLRMQHINKIDDTYFLNLYDTKNHCDNLIPVTKLLNSTLDNFQEFSINYKQLHYELKKLGVNAHLFRHSFITRSFESGLDSLTIMKLVNQKSMAVLKGYVHIQNKFLTEQVQKIGA